jgi:predicted CDP-diglyceride synthetase/phosphatidate cytidylyltransferase
MGRAVAEGTSVREVQWAEVVGYSRMGCMLGRRKWASSLSPSATVPGVCSGQNQTLFSLHGGAVVAATQAE